MVGTYHDLPFECLPKWFQSFIETQIDEVFIESKFSTSLLKMGNHSDISKYLPLTLQNEISSFLSPILNIYSKKVENLNLGELYSIIMLFDGLIGMDATIELLSLKLNKPLYMLDKEEDLVLYNLWLHKEMLKQEYLSTDILSERKAYLASLLESSDEQLMITYIKEEYAFLQSTLKKVS